MDEDGSPDPFIATAESKIYSLYPVFFGLSSSFFALGLLQQLKNAQNQIEQLKKARSEDGRANEKVMGIFAAREQVWFSERMKLTNEIYGLVEQLRAMEIEKEKNITEIGQRLRDTEAVFLSKDKSIERAELRRREMEEKLKETENIVQELRENSTRESQRHSNEILKQKKAFIELVSNQRQLEAEMGRALRQFEAAKQELVKMQKDLEQKDQILLALGTAKKDMLLKEVKSSKIMRKQSEMEMAKPERHLFRNMLSKRANHLKPGVFSGGKEVNRKPDVLSFGPKLYLTGAAHDELTEPEHLDSSISSEEETYEFVRNERHNDRLPIDAFAERLRLRDRTVSCLRQEILRLEALLLDRESELHFLKEQLVLKLNPPNLQNFQFGPSVPIDHGKVWSNLKIEYSNKSKRKPLQKKHEMDAICEEDDERPRDIVLTIEYPQKGKQENKIAHCSPSHIQDESLGTDDGMIIEPSQMAIKKTTPSQNCGLKVDIQALGVSYKIKRLKQQLVMLEKLIGKQESGTNCESENGTLRINEIYALTATLSKQVDRYQSLQGKTDDLCQRMEENNLNSSMESPGITKQLEHFLDETFQLQRYIVASGQKLMRLQAKISSGFAEDGEKTEMPPGFDTRRFAENIRTLFHEVQKGLEIRISRIIGGLEGTLTACIYSPPLVHRQLFESLSQLRQSPLQRIFLVFHSHFVEAMHDFLECFHNLFANTAKSFLLNFQNPFKQPQQLALIPPEPCLNGHQTIKSLSDW